MLEFIVLGLVPGTHIQLTFGNVLVLWMVTIASWQVASALYAHIKLAHQYELKGYYFTIVARKHWLTRKLQP